MYFPRTLSLYVGKNFAFWYAGIYGLLISLVALLEIIELLRRGASRELEATLLIKMAFLKLPMMIVEMAPFAVLIGGMLSFTHLTRSQELIVMRGAGISAWQFLISPLVITFLFGWFLVILFSPLSAATILRFEHLEHIHFKGQTSLIQVSKNGLWLRQADEDGQSVIHARRLNPQTMTLQKATIIRFDDQGKFIERHDAKNATLKYRAWDLRNVWTTKPGIAPVFDRKLDLKTSLTTDTITESFASPKTMSFWQLPAFIHSMQESGFSAIKHRLYFYNLLEQPFLLCAMLLVAAAFSLRIHRLGSIGWIAASGLILGFIFHFLADIVDALGEAGRLSVFLAAWAPGGIIMLLGLTFLLYQEDG